MYFSGINSNVLNKHKEKEKKLVQTNKPMKFPQQNENTFPDIETEQSPKRMPKCKLVCRQLHQGGTFNFLTKEGYNNL